MNMMKNRKVTVIGCGLIGGSVALALKRSRSGCFVSCIDLPERVPAIVEAGVADRVGTLEDAESYLSDSSIVILATPVQLVPEMIERICPSLKEGTIVTDVGSTKKQIMQEAGKRIPPGVHFIGGHPMAGSEQSGVEASDPLLFHDRVYVLCPFPDTPPDALLVLMDLAEDLHALPVTIDPEEHDCIMAMISHLPHVISVALMHAAMAGDAEHGMLDKMAGRGFLDMTRLAASDYGVWKGILETNKDGISQALSIFNRSLSVMADGISGESLALAWEQAGGKRRKMGPESMSRPRKQDLRTIIDYCDRQILAALARRVETARRIGKIKKNQSAPVTDPDRERRMLKQRSDWGKALGLSDELIDDLFAVILKHSTRVQNVV
jgi:prephenate dehydrogenase